MFAILAAGSVGGNTEAGKGNVNVAGSDTAPSPLAKESIRRFRNNKLRMTDTQHMYQEY